MFHIDVLKSKTAAAWWNFSAIPTFQLPRAKATGMFDGLESTFRSWEILEKYGKILGKSWENMEKHRKIMEKHRKIMGKSREIVESWENPGNIKKKSEEQSWQNMEKWREILYHGGLVRWENHLALETFHCHV